MTVALTILLMILGWAAAALALLWGMLRIARRRPVARPHMPPLRWNLWPGRRPGNGLAGDRNSLSHR